MLPLALPVLLAVPLGLAFGGSLAGWYGRRIHWGWLGLVALALQLALFNPPLERQPWAIDLGPWLYVGSMVAILVVLARNALDPIPGRSAWVVAALGVACNVAVVSANEGYMPQSQEARAVTGMQAPPDPRTRLTNVQPMTPDSRLPFLGDVIPEPAVLGRANVVSVGDLLLTLGITWLAFRVTQATPRARPAPGGAGSP